MSNLEFAVGKRVVCVRGPVRHMGCNCVQPIIGAIYTIRDIEAENCGEVILHLEEIHNDRRKHRGFEHYFVAARFRPVRETSIDCFTKLLETPPVKQTEAA